MLLRLLPAACHSGVAKGHNIVHQFFVQIANNPAMKPKLPLEIYISSFFPPSLSSFLPSFFPSFFNSGWKNYKSANNNIELNLEKSIHFTVKPSFYRHGNFRGDIPECTWLMWAALIWCKSDYITVLAFHPSPHRAMRPAPCSPKWVIKKNHSHWWCMYLTFPLPHSPYSPLTVKQLY